MITVVVLNFDFAATEPATVLCIGASFHCFGNLISRWLQGYSKPDPSLEYAQHQPFCCIDFIESRHNPMTISLNPRINFNQQILIWLHKERT